QGEALGEHGAHQLPAAIGSLRQGGLVVVRGQPAHRHARELVQLGEHGLHTAPPTFSKYTSMPSGAASARRPARSGARWSRAASTPSSRRRATLRSPPAMPIVRAPWSFAIWATAEPTGPVAAAT